MPEAFYKEDPAKVKKQSTSIKRQPPPSGNPNLSMDEDGSADEDDSAMELGGRDPRDRLLSERRLDKRERESYKHSFLTKFIEKYENEE